MVRRTDHSAGPGGLLDVALLKDGTLGVVYETGKVHPYEKIAFARFQPGWPYRTVARQTGPAFADFAGAGYGRRRLHRRRSAGATRVDADSRVILDTEVTTGAKHDSQPYLEQLQVSIMVSLPEVGNETLQGYYDYLTSHLFFPFQARYPGSHRECMAFRWQTTPEPSPRGGVGHQDALRNEIVSGKTSPAHWSWRPVAWLPGPCRR